MNQEEKETEDWLALLAGKQVVEADPKLVWETNALRAELAYRRNPPPLNSKILENILAQLPPVKSSLWEVFKNQTKAWLKSWERPLSIGVAVAASVLMIVVILQIIIPPSEPDYRIKAGAISQSLLAPNPQAKAHELKMALEQLGISVKVVQDEAVWIVQTTDLSNINSENLTTLLAKYDLLLPPPPETQLIVRIKKE
jgi:hypothetical protein